MRKNRCPHCRNTGKVGKEFCICPSGKAAKELIDLLDAKPEPSVHFVVNRYEAKNPTGSH